jgi:hypothetical protein
VSSTVECPSGDPLLQGGGIVTISNSGNQSLNAGQGVHVIGGYPSDSSADPLTSGSASDWSYIAEDGGIYLASLSDEAVTLCYTG